MRPCGVSRVSVDECTAEFRYDVGEFVFGVVCNVVGIVEAEPWIYVEFGVGVQAVADPAHARCLSSVW